MYACIGDSDYLVLIVIIAVASILQIFFYRYVQSRYCKQEDQPETHVNSNITYW